MPGPMSTPVRSVDGRRIEGKTAVDRASGKAARHEQNRNRRAEENRNGPSRKGR